MKNLKDLKMKPQADLEKLTAEKLNEEVKSSEKMLYTMRMKLAVGEMKQTHLVKTLRRYIASLKTLANRVK